MPLQNLFRDASVTEDWQAGGFAIYVHWPFCQSKCPYCDFNSHVRGSVDHGRWQRALVREIENSAKTVPGRSVDSVFFGGGTPSLMAPETVHTVISAIRSNWAVSNDLEVTLEANPTSVEAGKFASFAQAGVNRLSMGIQSLKDSDLKSLGRLHTAAEARRAFDIARDHFSRVSFDLIYARQAQTLADWQDELSEAAEMAVDHLSLYQLTIEAGTRFGELYQKGRLRDLPTADTSAEMYERTQEICDLRGFSSYEVSNHAVKGAESRHNLVYWRYGDYAGVGPGAHGRLTVNGQRLATESCALPEEWLLSVEKQGTAIRTSEVILASDQASEYLMMSLRLSEGSDLNRFAALAGSPISDARIESLTEQGLLERVKDRIRTVGSGRMVLNAVLRELLI